MTSFFDKIEKLKPFYDTVYKIVFLICKILLVVDILITSVAVAGRYISFIPDPSWSEEIVLTLMAYMAVLSAALAIRNGAHIRMTALDKYLKDTTIKKLDLLADFMVLILGLVMLIVGWRYSLLIGGKGYYVSLPNLSRFWMYFPIPLAGLAMVVFEIEKIISDLRFLLLKEENYGSR